MLIEESHYVRKTLAGIRAGDESYTLHRETSDEYSPQPDHSALVPRRQLPYLSTVAWTTQGVLYRK
jgi:hypothetical protein